MILRAKTYVEYALSTGMMAVMVVGALPPLRTTLVTVFSKIVTIIETKSTDTELAGLSGSDTAGQQQRECRLHAPARSKPNRTGSAPAANNTGVLNMLNRIRNANFWKDCQGQDLVEYALMAGMVAVAAVAAMPALTSTMQNVFTKIGSIIDAHVQ